jgi:hypothetical protein
MNTASDHYLFEVIGGDHVMGEWVGIFKQLVLRYYEGGTLGYLTVGALEEIQIQQNRKLNQIKTVLKITETKHGSVLRAIRNQRMGR